MREGRTTEAEVTSHEGRVVAVSNRPIDGGGWVAMHEDISDRRKAERERASMQEQQHRRIDDRTGDHRFRRGVEEHLRSVADGAQAMRSTAAALFASSGQTSQSAQGAVTASNEASTNVETAAVAADELTGSIGEIGRQLDVDHRYRAQGGRPRPRAPTNRSRRWRQPRRRSATSSS